MTEAENIFVYIDGVWDLFHPSHLKFISSVRSHAANELHVEKNKIKIVAGVISDKDVMSYKRVPIMNEDQRARMLEACSYVDVVVRNSPLIIPKDLLQAFNISLVYHGNDSKQEEFFKVAIDSGIMRYVKYDDEVSTTKLIAKIQKM